MNTVAPKECQERDGELTDEADAFPNDWPETTKPRRRKARVLFVLVFALLIVAVLVRRMLKVI